MSTEATPSDNSANPYESPQTTSFAKTKYEPPRGRSIFEHIVRPKGKRRAIMAICNGVMGAMFGALLGFLGGLYHEDFVWAYQGALLGGSAGTILAMVFIPRPAKPGDRPRFGARQSSEEAEPPDDFQVETAAEESPAPDDLRIEKPR